MSHIAFAITLAAAAPAAGGDGDASISIGSGGASADSSADASGSAGGESRWIKRYAPRARTFELGAYAGVLVPDSDIELHRPTLPQQSFRGAAPDFGLRVGYYPLRFFGFEGELGLMPTSVDNDERATMFTARAHGVLQLGLWSVTPFIVAGGGVLAVRSGDASVGNNADEAFHFGGGLKVYLHRNVGIRLDVRDILSPKLDDPNSAAHNIEATIGVAVPLGPWKKKETAPPPPPDRDGDGVVDDVDACPTVAGEQDDGCPVPDFDSDGIPDAEDECPCEASSEPNGCLIHDTDEDGVPDPEDACRLVAGDQPDGCPNPDLDGDGIDNDKDRCPREAEVVNGFDDEDGCADDVPPEIAKFTGVIEGIYFDTGKSTIRAKSTTVLDGAAEVLARFTHTRVEVSGHTDDRGKPEMNRTLSLERAEAVKQYLVDHGVDRTRIVTRGAGPDEPIGDNTTKDGRAKNRRIEFKLLQ